MIADSSSLVDYASVVALELRQPNNDSAQTMVRFNFKNGSDPQLTTYNWMNTTEDVNLQLLSSTLSVRAIALPVHYFHLPPVILVESEFYGEWYCTMV